MKSALAYVFLFGSFVAAGWSSLQLFEAVNTPARDLPSLSAMQSTPSAVAVGEMSLPFLAIYGAPVATTEDAPIAERPDETFGYVLKGLIAVGEARWAVLSRDGVDVVVREGEVLMDGAEVTKVQAEGIEIATDTGLMVLGFNSDTPVARAEIPATSLTAEASGTKGNFNANAPRAVLFQDMTTDEILAALEQAEERRIARGWVTNSE